MHTFGATLILQAQFGHANVQDNSRIRFVVPVPDAFRIPDLYTFGNLGRHRLRTDAFWNLDVSLFRAFPLRERLRFELRAAAFNVTNTAIFGIPLSDMSAPANFGRMTSTANNERKLQLGVKFIW